MNRCFNGLSSVNIELTSRCNKKCWMCGRRKIDRDHPEIAMKYGDMDFKLVQKLAKQLPSNIDIQFHNNGEPTLYPRLGEALSLFKTQLKNFDTNGKLIVEKADEIIGNLDTMTISVIENDDEGKEQYEKVLQFIDLRKEKTPNLIYRLLGKVDDRHKWENLPGIVANRILHNPLGSFKYSKNPTKPEIGICLEVLHKLCIDRFGKVSPCVRFDPKRYGVIGDLEKQSLYDIWNGEERRILVKKHIKGNRDGNLLCSNCHFWGVPTGD